MPVADTPDPPYVAVIFTTERSDDHDGLDETDARLMELVRTQPGFLGVESVAGTEAGITVSYWVTAEDARAWKRVAEHEAAQRLGRHRWFRRYRVRVTTVDREYGSA